jgi:ABC-type oligopeptide transport system substrate-binding subunit
MIGIPENCIAKIFEGRIEDFNSKPPVLVMHNNPLLTTNYYSFNLTDVRFQNIKVRQAFNYALNKQMLDQEVLHKQYSALGYYGIVPPVAEVFKGYDYVGINKYGYTFQPEKAKKLLAEAGYPKGRKFGIVELRINNNGLHAAVAAEVSKQLKACLNIEVKIIRSSFEQKNKAAIEANGALFASAWTADYADPETFLANFYGKNIPSDREQKSTINIARYSNSVFDILFEQAKNSTKKTDAFDYYAKAEKVLLQDPPFIPLWYSGDIQLVYSSVRNLHFNVMNMFIFKEVYKKEWTTDEYLHTSK